MDTNEAPDTAGGWKRRYDRLERSRSGGVVVGTVKRFFDIDGLTQGGLLAIELFTTVIPLMIIGFSYISGFDHQSAGNVFVDTLGLGDSSAAVVRSAFGASSGLRSTWTVLGIAGFLVWGIPMSITVASMFAVAWRRGQFSLRARLWRGGVWFISYLMVLALQAPVVGHHHPALERVEFAAPDIVVIWLFWTLSPVLLVRDGWRGGRSLLIAGLAGALIEGVILPAAAVDRVSVTARRLGRLRANRCGDDVDDVVRGGRCGLGRLRMRRRCVLGAPRGDGRRHPGADRGHRAARDVVERAAPSLSAAELRSRSMTSRRGD